MLRTWTRWIAYPLIMLAVLLVATIPHALARMSQASAPTNQFRITSFEADYVVDPQNDGTTDVLVTERIVADIPGSGINRGILRAIPLRYQDHRNTLTELSVTGDVSTQWFRPGADRQFGPDPQRQLAEQPFVRTDEKDVVLLRIGDPETYLSRGPQLFEIRYRLGDVALNTPDGTAQEIYLDANGSGWEVPFDRVTANLHVPVEYATSLSGDAACYWGPEGATNRCEVTRRTTDHATVFTGSTTNVDRRSGLTLAVGFNPGTFPVAYTPTRGAVPWWLFILPGVGGLAYLINLARYLRARGVSRPDVLVTEYQPPRGVPALAAADIMGRPEKGPTAQLLDFAAAGVLHLRASDPAEPRPDGPARPLGLLARRRLRRTLSIPRADFDAIEDPLLQTLMKGYFGLGLGVTPDAITASELAERQARLVTDGGWRKPAPDRPQWFGFAVFMFLVAGGLGMYAIQPRGNDFWWALASGVIGMLLVIAALYRTPAFGPLTAEGHRVRHHLLGLRHFIAMSEANRIAWLQGVESSPIVGREDHAGLVKIYEPLLPYAVIFGLEKSWTAVLGEHQRVLPDAHAWVPDLGALPLGEIVRTLDHGYQHRDTDRMGGFRFIGDSNAAVGRGFRGFGEVMGDALSAMTSGDNDGGGSRGSGSRGSGGGWSSGGSRGGGRSGGGMGGGGGGGW
ncbi:MAG: DUF2207 domain-containing protein [Propionibacteriaceae bacterium]|nr:DUF2207 domain-containing protein [Propionibacteriaceae bacterium]